MDVILPRDCLIAPPKMLKVISISSHLLNTESSLVSSVSGRTLEKYDPMSLPSVIHIMWYIYVL